MDITNLVLAILGIIATIFVAWLVDRRTKRLIKRVEAMQISEMSPEKYKTFLRLYEDMERTGAKQGTIKQNPEGKWIIVWDMEIKDGIKLKAVVNAEKKEQN